MVPTSARLVRQKLLAHSSCTILRLFVPGQRRPQLRDNLLGDVYRLILLQLDLELLTSMPFDGTYHGRGRLTELGLMQNRLL